MRHRSLFYAAAVCSLMGAVVYVDRAPPPRRVEVVPVRPGPEYVWVAGYWTWGAPREYVWTPGRWQRPPRAHARWVEGRWRKHGHEWYWQPGHWK
jgi:hypothetical protein